MSDTYRLLRFGVFELNLDLEELRKNGTLLKLPPQPFKMLALLASRSGQVVTRDEIQEQLWGNDTFIDFEQGVNKCIKQIRTALSDNPDNPLYLETIPRRGYRFLAPVRTKTIPAPPPQVKEASSGLLANVVGQVRDRVAAATPGATPTPHAASDDLTPLPVSEPAPTPTSPPQRTSNRLIWILIPFLLVLAAVVFWLVTHSAH
ncbi:MAG: winged helix-turn-helix domain-containing protein [Candidatus Korobacteraceae bacterium]